MAKGKDSGGIRELKEQVSRLTLGSPKGKKSFRATASMIAKKGKKMESITRMASAFFKPPKTSGPVEGGSFK
jgi:hypothetical protein